MPSNSKNNLSNKKKVASKETVNRKVNSKDIEPNISLELLKIWKANTRSGDVAQIIALATKKKISPKSRPMITMALKYGYCPSDALNSLITRYFADRNKREEVELEALQESTKK